MSKQQHPNPDDLLERAVAAFRKEQIPDGPSPGTFTDTLLALRGVEQTSSIFKRVIVMIQTHKIAASFATAVGGMAIYGSILFFGSFASISYAQVADQLRAIHSMSCTFTMQSSPNSIPISMRAMFMDPGKVRMELPGSNIVVISDSQAHRNAVLDTLKKTCTLAKLWPFLSNAGSPQTQPAAASPNLIDFFKNLSNDKATPTADRRIDGINANGFRSKYGGIDATIYVHPQTGLPLEVDYDRVMGKLDVKFTHFDFDSKLDPSLFSLEAPPGYATQTIDSPVTSTDVGENLVPVLRAYAQQANGQFPPNLDDTGGVVRMVVGRAHASKKPDAEFEQMMEGFFSARLRLPQSSRGTDWDYFPTSAKLGEADKIILWYQLKGTATYKAIYGDLHLAEVTVDQLPKATTPPER